VFINPSAAYVNSARGPRLAPGFTTFIALDKNVDSSLPSPYSDCLKVTNQIDADESPLFKLIVGAGFSYTQEACNNLFIQSQVIANCGCFSTVVDNLINGSVRACSSIADNACNMKTVAQLIKSDFKSTTHKLCNLHITLLIAQQ
jgi:hypothetical protein